MNALHSRILELWREGKSPKEITADALVPSSWPSSRISNFITIARDLLGEETVPRPRINTPVSLLEEVARLWREGLSCVEIDARIGRHDSAGLVQRARQQLGTIAVPKRQIPAEQKPPGIITMMDANRHFLRRVGDEYIFRHEACEEIWMEGANGLRFTNMGGGTARLVFKCRMGMTEKRSA